MEPLGSTAHLSLLAAAMATAQSSHDEFMALAAGMEFASGPPSEPAEEPAKIEETAEQPQDLLEICSPPRSECTEEEVEADDELATKFEVKAEDEPATEDLVEVKEEPKDEFETFYEGELSGEHWQEAGHMLVDMLRSLEQQQQQQHPATPPLEPPTPPPPPPPHEPPRPPLPEPLTPPWRRKRKQLCSPPRPPASSSSASSSHGPAAAPRRHVSPPAFSSSASSSHRPQVSPGELLDLRAEAQVAREMGIRWQHRGPPPECLPEGQTTWRGQRYRPNTGKWANRGGSAKAWYTAFYRAKQEGEAALSKFLEENPHPKKG